MAVSMEQPEWQALSEEQVQAVVLAWLVVQAQTVSVLPVPEVEPEQMGQPVWLAGQVLPDLALLPVIIVQVRLVA